MKPILVRVDSMFIHKKNFPLMEPVTCKVVRMHGEIKAMFPNLKCSLEGKWKRSGQIYAVGEINYWVLDSKRSLENFYQFIVRGHEEE